MRVFVDETGVASTCIYIWGLVTMYGEHPSVPIAFKRVRLTHGPRKRMGDGRYRRIARSGMHSRYLYRYRLLISGPSLLTISLQLVSAFFLEHPVAVFIVCSGSELSCSCSPSIKMMVL